MTTDIARLESRIGELEQQQKVLEEQLLNARVEQLEGRIDDLELQLHLGELELRDRIAPLVERLRNQWLDVKSHLSVSTANPTDALDALRSGVEQAVGDLRSAIDDARKAALR